MNTLLKTLLVFASILYCTITAIILFPRIVYAETILFEDNFNDGNVTDWFVVGDSGWNINNGQYGILLNPGLSNTLPITWDESNTSIVYDVDIVGNQGEDRNILIKFRDTSNFLEVHANANGIFLDKASSLGGGGVQGYTGITLANGIPYHFKIEVKNNQHIKVYLNNALIIEADENAPLITNWRPGLRAGTGGTPITEVWFDNVKITTLEPEPSTTPTPTPTPTTTPLPVPDLKQYSLPWKNQVYDRAMSWSDNPSIERWGCALTSASMILKFWGHGDYANPDLLNNWLRTQPDGYIGDGYLNWLAVTRFSLIHSTPTTPALEFRRIENTNDNLDNELASGRPAILKVPGHFFVATGKTPDSYSLNDPAHNDRPTLASYENSFTALNTFTPTYTDLSYLLLTINPAFNLKIFDKNGDEILVNPYIEDPLSDDLEESSSSAKPLKIYLLPKPVEGQYIIEVSNSKGPYQLSTYIYDKDGEVDVKKKNGRLNKNNSKDKISLKVSSKKKWHLWPLPPKFPWPLKDWGHE